VCTVASIHYILPAKASNADLCFSFCTAKKIARPDRFPVLYNCRIKFPTFLFATLLRFKLLPNIAMLLHLKCSLKAGAQQLHLAVLCKLITGPAYYSTGYT